MQSMNSLPTAATPDALHAAPKSEDFSAMRIPELDSFRAAAVLMVLLSHCVYGWPLPDASTAWIPRTALALISHGWLGVDLFFILSGYLITGLLLDARSGERYFKNFYARRVLRIVPLYAACILVMFFAYRNHAAYFGLSLLFLANFSTYFRVGVPHGPGVFWSLSVEEHFYLLWPLFVRCLSRNVLLVVSLLIVIGSPLLRGISAYRGMDPESEIYLYSFFRFDGLALGALLAIWVRSAYFSRATAIRLALVLAGLVVVVTVGGLPYGIMGSKTVASVAFRYTQAQLLFAACIALALAYRGMPQTKFLRTGFASLTSGFSYCIYLVHLSLGDLYYWILNKNAFNDVVHFGPVGALGVRCIVVIGSSYAIAAISKKFLEDPFLRLKRYF